MKKTVSVEYSSMHRITEWLLGQLQSMEKQFETGSIKNSSEPGTRLRVFLSFDIKALFPMEIEKEGQLPFLDLFLRRKGMRLDLEKTNFNKILFSLKSTNYY